MPLSSDTTRRGLLAIYKVGKRSPKAQIAKRFHEIGVRTVVVKLGDRGLSLVLIARSQRSQ